MTRPELLLTEQAPPGDMELEHAVLGAALLNADEAHRIAAEMRPEDFLSDANRIVFIRTRELVDAGRGVDLLTLSRALMAHGELDDVGGGRNLRSSARPAPPPCWCPSTWSGCGAFRRSGG